MKATGIRELKTHLSRFIEEAQQGEIIYITGRGRVVAEMHAPRSTAPAEASAEDGRVRAITRIRGFAYPFSFASAGSAPDCTLVNYLTQDEFEALLEALRTRPPYCAASAAPERRAVTLVFVNARGHRLSRFGVTHILRKAVERAAASSPALADRTISPQRANLARIGRALGRARLFSG